VQLPGAGAGVGCGVVGAGVDCGVEGAGAGVGVGGACVGADVGVGCGGVGAGAPANLKSMQERKVSGDCVAPQAALGVPPAAWYSDFLKDCVFHLPTLLKSLQVFPTFQSQRPTAWSVGHVKEEGTWYVMLRPPPLDQAYIPGLLGK